MKNMHIVITAMIFSSLLLAVAVPTMAADKTITDQSGDVNSIDIYGEESTIVTSSPDINVNNIDITQVTYTKTGGSAVVTLTVKGTIEDLGNILDLTGDFPENFTEIQDVEYEIALGTSLAGSQQEMYTVSYVNKQCQLMTSDYNTTNLTSSQFSVSGSTLSVTIPLNSPDEAFASLNATTTFLKFNLTGLENADNPDDFGNLYTFLTDIAPNPPLEAFILYAPNVGSVGESLQFNGSVSPLTGQPPYAYLWNFGDGITSQTQNPTHTYAKAGTFTYNLTVTDQSNTKSYESGTIEITSESGGDTGIGSSPLLLFLAVIIVIAAIGIVVLIVIIRRR